MTTTNTAAVETMRAAIGQLLNEFGERQWQSGRGVPHKSLEEAFDAIIERAALATPAQAVPAARGAAQAAPVDAAVQRESQYNRGFRHGYNRRDAEVKGALA